MKFSKVEISVGTSPPGQDRVNIKWLWRSLVSSPLKFQQPLGPAPASHMIILHTRFQDKYSFYSNTYPDIPTSGAFVSRPSPPLTHLLPYHYHNNKILLNPLFPVDPGLSKVKRLCAHDFPKMNMDHWDENASQTTGRANGTRLKEDLGRQPGVINRW